MHMRLNKLIALPLLVMTMLLATACPKHSYEADARDTLAGLKGAIESAQSQHLNECKADPKKDACVQINQAVDGQNALATALTTYCGYSTSAPPPDPATAKCTPVKSAEQGLIAATNNAKQLTQEVKGAVKPQ